MRVLGLGSNNFWIRSGVISAITFELGGWLAVTGEYFPKLLEVSFCKQIIVLIVGPRGFERLGFHHHLK